MLTSHQASHVSPKTLYYNVSLVKKLNQVSRLSRTTMGQVFTEFSQIIYFPPNSQP